MKTDNLFWGSRADTLKENATITYVRGISLNYLEGIFRGDSKARECLDIFFDLLNNQCMGGCPRRRIGSKSIKKRLALLPKVLIEIRNIVERS